jgi:hypothetical protein
MTTGDPPPTGEGHRVKGARQLAFLDLRLSDRGLEVDVPQGRRLGPVSLAAVEATEEGALGDRSGTIVDRGVRECPVDGQPDVAP